MLRIRDPIRIAALPLLALLLAFVLPSTLPAMGADANLDGVVDVRDVQRIALIVLATTPAEWPGHGDVNNDSQVDATDVQATVNIILQQPTTLHMPAPTRLPWATPGVQYAVRLPAAGGTPPYAWSYSGTLPPGFSFSTDGWLTGFPGGLGHHFFDLILTDSASTSVTYNTLMQVKTTNLPPVAVPDSFVFLGQQSSINIPAPGVLGNDIDPDNDPLSTVLVSSPPVGTLLLSPDGSFSYTTTATTNYQTSFQYSVTDGQYTSPPATVTIEVRDGPKGIPDDYFTAFGQQITIPAPGVLGNDLIPTTQWQVEVELHSQALNGTVTLAVDGSFDYQPMPGYYGEDEFMYRVFIQTPTVTLEDFALARIYVHDIGKPNDPYLSGYMVENPVMETMPAHVVARFRSPNNNMPASHQLLSIEVQRGADPPVQMSLRGHTSQHVAEFEAQLSTTGWGFGIHDLLVTATTQGNQQLTCEVTVAVYQGVPIRVGPTRLVTNISAGLSLAQPGRGVLVDPGTYGNALDLGLAMTDCILAGAQGLHRTRVVSAASRLIDSVATPGGIIMGFSIKPTGACAIRLNGDATVYQVRVAEGVISTQLPVGSEESVGIEVDNASVIVAESAIRECIMEVPGGLGLYNTPVAMIGGPAVTSVASNLTVRRSRFYSNRVLSGYAFGGAIMFRGPTSQSAPYPRALLVHDCYFSLNQARGLSPNSLNSSTSMPTAMNHAVGRAGAIFVDGLSVLELWDTGFHENTAESTGTAYGGVMHFTCNVTTSKIVRCRMWDNTAKGHLFVDPEFPINSPMAAGGALYIYDSSYYQSTGVEGFQISASHFLRNRVYTESEGYGGAIWTDAPLAMVATKIQQCEVLNLAGTQPVYRGGGIEATGGFALHMLLCEISECRAAEGGAIYARGRVMLMLDQCHIKSNYASTSVAGIWVQGVILAEHTEFSDNIVPGNSSPAVAIHDQTSFAYLQSGTNRFHNCLFSGNVGGATLQVIESSSGPTIHPLSIVNSTFVDNTGGCVNHKFSTTSLTNCILWSNGGTILAGPSTQYSLANNCLQPTSPPWTFSGQYATLASPPAFTVGPQGQFYLALSSPCIDYGTLTGIPSGLLSGLTTIPSEAPDTGQPDLGYHRVPVGAPRQPRSTMTYAQFLQSHGTNTQASEMPPLLLIYE